MTPLVRAKVGRHTGTTQVPAARLPDGRWMTDTTPMIAWLESQHPEPAVIPRDPLQAFASRLLEDYADEWLWRPALHYRWSHLGDALLLSRRIVDEMMPRVPLPGWLKRWSIRQQQLRRYVRGDGIGPGTRGHVESIYLRCLDELNAIFALQSFLLGDRPTLSDFGFFASMFRHFGLDPTPSAIMLQRAPHIFAWLGRVWEARGTRVAGTLASGIPAAWSPILREVGEAYLPYLSANAEAWKAHARRFNVTIQGTCYCGLPVSRYRVWCLEELRRHFDALSGDARTGATELLERHSCWEPLWRVATPASGYDPEGAAPFTRGLPVFSR